MYLRLRKGAAFDISAPPPSAINWDRAENEAACVLVYGHPYQSDTSTWLNASDVLKLYAEKGLDLVGDLDGMYSLIFVDKAENRCHVVVDRYGLAALFCAAGDDHFIVSDDLHEAATLSGNTALDRQALVEYLVTEYIYGSRTLFEGVSLCEPATIYHVDAGLTLTRERYWDLQGAPASDALSDEQWRERFNSHVGGIVEQAEALSMPLTGGVDTRTVFSACVPWAGKLHCWTHGRPGAPDIRLAQRICDHFDTPPHVVHELDDDWVADLPAAFEADAGIVNGMAAALKVLHAERSFRREQSRAGILLSGVMGNEIWRCAYAPYIKGGRSAGEIADRLAAMRNDFRRRGVAEGLRIFNTSTTGNIDDVLRASMDEEIAAAPDPNDWLSVVERFSYRVFCWKWCGFAMQAAAKYFKVFPALLQKDLVPRVALLPIERRNAGDIQRLIIDGNNRFLGNLALDKAGYIRPTLTARARALRQKALYYLDGACRRLLHLRGFLTPGVNRLDWLRPHASWLETEILAYDRLRTGALFHRQPYEAVIGAFFKGANANGLFVANLVSLELYLRHVGWAD